MKTFALLWFFSLVGAGWNVHAFTLQVDSAGTLILPWTSNTITFDFNYADCNARGVTADQMNSAVDDAFAVWNSTLTSNVHLVRGTAVTKTSAQIKAQSTGGNPLILCDANLSADITREGQTAVDTNNIPAVTQVLRVDGDSHIALAVVYINADPAQIDNVAKIIGRSNILDVVLAHELGHAIGLGHSADKNALMYYDASFKTALGLARDDVDGITYLYPRHEPSGAKIFGCGTLGGAVVTRSDFGKPPGSGGATSAVQFFGLLALCAALTQVAKKGVYAPRFSAYG